jgi:peptidoglycan/xylan/chitin deacetylase (PgdA/CDA1 family)
MSKSIPVLAYHSIAASEKMKPSRFETHLQVLIRSKLPSLLPKDLVSAKRGFLLTFDDGFADFWTHVYPLLEQYGVRAVVFVIPSRTGTGDCRPQGKRAFQDNANQAHQEAGEQKGPHDAFLRWAELEAMEQSGLVEVQSHTMSHKSVWRGDHVTGFNLGSANHTHWSLAQTTNGDKRLGIPLYPRGSAMAFRRYEDDRGLRDTLAGWIEKRGGQAYIGAEDVESVEAELWEQTRNYIDSHGHSGRWETVDERIERTDIEIIEARQTLQERLGGSRDELCLPWGTYDDISLQCAKRAGIKRVYTLDRGANPAGRIGFRVNRFEPRPRGKIWLMSRIWIYRSVLRCRVYTALSRR